MNYELADIIGRSRWLIEPSAMRRILADAATATEDAIQARIAACASRGSTPNMVGDVAVIEISGPITYRETYFSRYFGGSTIERLQAQFRMALADPNAKAIIFRVDSPGGSVDMVPEFAAEVFKARGQKPILSVSDTLMASAAYWIASQADQIIVSPSSVTGSIGVLMAHEDISSYLEQLGIKITLIFAGTHKVDGNPFEPLPDDVRDRWKAKVDEVHDDFLSAVARGRGTTAADVRKRYGQGLVYMSKEAVKLGLANRVGTFEETLGRASKVRSGGARAELIEAEFDNGTAQICSTHNIEVEPENACPSCVAETQAAVLATQREADLDYADAAIRIRERL